ncbi:hypothetical protein [Stenotrophomonas sp. GD03657]|uniref:hypothetical protein n=1 Tax=Stenotrophomonas sp. GD03657 TaxID=2975363 RepID=UPI00244D6BD1|nr:hypothetical protein [Stenotrophomonas sp. GD03657]MDH2154212.1 hypothetical protein [Stenotrophomonas sp. GD03657]
MWSWILYQLQWLLWRKDLERLERYRLACQDVQRWNASLPHSAQTADYIHNVGEGHIGADISRFREELRNNFPIPKMEPDRPAGRTVEIE